MPRMVQEKIDWLSIEVNSLKARMQGSGNAVQEHKLEILSDILADYTKSMERSREKQVRSAEDGS